MQDRSALGLHRSQQGVMLLALLIVLALAGVAAMAAADVWALSRQRELELQLMFVGNEYRQAIQRYYFGAPPGGARVLPARLEDLLEDDRYPVPVRHLRRLYPDPFSADGQWGVLKLGERVAGVYSQSESKPVKRAGFTLGYTQFEASASYRDWLFAVTATGQPMVARPQPVEVPPRGFEPPVPNQPPRRTPS